MRKNIIFIIILCLSCQFKKEAVGITNDLIIFSSIEDKELLSPVIQKYFNNIGAYCPQFETLFNIRWKLGGDLDEFHMHRNLLFLSIKNPPDTTLDLFINKMNLAIKNDRSLFSTKNLYAYSQIVSSIQAYDAIHFKTILDSNFKWLFNNKFCFIWES